MRSAIRMNAENDGRVMLVVEGEESDPVDLTQYAQRLLDARAKKGPVDITQDADNLVSFATLYTVGTVTFTRDGVEVSVDEALGLIADSVIDALIETVDGLDLADTEEQHPKERDQQ